MFAGVRKIERYSLSCPILLSPLSDSISILPILSLTKNISAQGAYIFGRPQWSEQEPMFASLFYEISTRYTEETNFRFLIRFRARAIRTDDEGFALEFSRKNRILPLSKLSAMTHHEVRTAEMIEYMFPPGRS